MKGQTLGSLIANEKAILNEIESIINESTDGILTEDQALRIEELEKQLYGSKEDIYSKIDAYGYYITEIQKEIEGLTQWAKNYQTAKKNKRRIN